MDITPIMENQMEKNMENEMESGVLGHIICPRESRVQGLKSLCLSALGFRV